MCQPLTHAIANKGFGGSRSSSPASIQAVLFLTPDRNLQKNRMERKNRDPGFELFGEMMDIFCCIFIDH
jgi:hypothetical protein